MKDEFVDYEIAYIMKEIGFDDPCFATYSNHDQKLSGLPLINMEGLPANAIEYSWKNSSIHPTNIAAPLYQQVFRWFRDEYQLDTEISIVFGSVKYSTKVVDRNNYKNPHICGSYDTYEEAELACINKLIELGKWLTNY